jgi:hypothetical protein
MAGNNKRDNMSHLAVNKSVKIRDKAALAMACDQLGLEILDQRDYVWYGRSVGDYPIPAGMDRRSMGHNATFIARIKEPKRSELTRRNSGQAPYDLAFIEDPEEPGTYFPVCDYFMGGYGLHEIVGQPIHEGGELKSLCPRLKQHYDMCCDALAAREAGDQIEFMTMKDASARYPESFPKSDDEQTWVSVVHTEQRLGA